MEHGKYLLAATFGNAWRPASLGNVKLSPRTSLRKGQQVAAAGLDCRPTPSRSTSCSTLRLGFA